MPQQLLTALHQQKDTRQMETEEGIKAKNSEVFFLLLSEEKLGFIPAWSTVTMQKY